MIFLTFCLVVIMLVLLMILLAVGAWWLILPILIDVLFITALLKHHKNKKTK